MPFNDLYAREDMHSLATDPKSPADMRIGEPVAVGLYADWTLLDTAMTGQDEGIMLAVRPHRYRPFVTERFEFRHDDHEFIVWSGIYHETLTAALGEFRNRIGNPDKNTNYRRRDPQPITDKP